MVSMPRKPQQVIPALPGSATQLSSDSWRVRTKNTFVELQSQEQAAAHQRMTMVRSKTWAFGLDRLAFGLASSERSGVPSASSGSSHSSSELATDSYSSVSESSICSLWRNFEARREFLSNRMSCKERPPAPAKVSRCCPTTTLSTLSPAQAHLAHLFAPYGSMHIPTPVGSSPGRPAAVAPRRRGKSSNVMHVGATTVATDCKPQLSRPKLVTSTTGLPVAKKAQGASISVEAAPQSSDEGDEDAVPVVSRGVDEVTVMLRNIPVQLELQNLLEAFDSVGLHGAYDLVYLPMDFRAQVSLGFAFVNLVSARAHAIFIQHFDRQPFVSPNNQRMPGKHLTVALAKVQGVLGNVAEFRDSPVMSGKVPANCKPHLFDQLGNSLPFPEPTKKLKRLKLRKNAKVRPGGRRQVAERVAAAAAPARR